MITHTLPKLLTTGIGFMNGISCNRFHHSFRLFSQAPKRITKYIVKPINAHLILCISFAFCSQVFAEKTLTLPASAGQVLLSTSEDSTLGTLPNGIGVQLGTTIPSTVVHDHLGVATDITTLSADQVLMVVFYRGGWCPYCNLQIRQMVDNYSRFQDRGVLPVFISVDKPDAAALAQKSYEIPFPVLSDPQLVAHKAFNVVLEQSEETASRYKEYGIDLEAWSGQTHGNIAVSSVFLLDKTATVQWAHASIDYKTRPSVNQLIHVIDQLIPTL
ncbi:hypothetical protein NBRC116495_02020 [Aurantivibrio plasticivorans]